MPLLYKPDSEEVFKRHEAFWHREIIDHPPLPGSFVFPKAGAKPFPEKTYATLEEKWLDIDYRAERMAYEIGQRDYLYDAIPIAFPNLGPEIFSAWYGCGYAFGETTTWTLPVVHDVEKDAVRLDMNHPLFQKLVDFTARLIELGRGKFVVGLTDFHPGGDHLAALRDPVNLNLDLIENPEWVERMLSQSMAEYYAAYGVFYHMIHRAGMVTTSWLNIVHDGTYYIPSNDFSCMISTAMFERFFLPGIRQECRFYERSCYHLDGPGALRHLDTLLSIPELDAIQWVPGAGAEGFARWREVYRRIQRGGKGIWLSCQASELDDIFDSLRPEGVFFGAMGGVRTREEAEAVAKRIMRWK